MNTKCFKAVFKAATLALALAGAQGASAGILVTLAENNDGVLMTYSGTIDVTNALANGASKQANQAQGLIRIDPAGMQLLNLLTVNVSSIGTYTPGNTDTFSGVFVTPFTAFGTGSALDGQGNGLTRTGVNFGLQSANLSLPTQAGNVYTVDGSLLWKDYDFATLGITDGYDETRLLKGETEGSDNFVTFKVGSAIGGGNDVPEPGTLALLGLASAGLATQRRLKNRR